MHRSYVRRNRELNRYEAVCEICGIFATSPTKKGEMEQRAARHEGRTVPPIIKRAPKNAPVQVARVGAIKTKEDWKRYIKDNHLPHLGAGIARTTYALDDKRVIKICIDGTWQSEKEVERWTNATEEQRQFLAPILEYGKGWTIMMRATMTLDQFGGQANIISTDLSRATKVPDLHGGNIGYFPDGRFRIIDYGF